MQTEGPIRKFPATSAEEFWDYLSPQKNLFGRASKPVFRGQQCGQESAPWHLEPSILRAGKHPIYSSVFGSSPDVSEHRIFAEIALLDSFANYCDSSGLAIPGDCPSLRKHLDPTTVMDEFILHRQIWPSEEYFQIMALAQHHNLPTRLLDWTRRSYVAAYFAASTALANASADQGGLAVWALDTQAPTLKDLKFIKIPGSNNPNIAAQAGLFTLLVQGYKRGQPFVGPHSLDEYVISRNSDGLAKITLPGSEAPKVIDLCEKYGITSATLYPDYYGAAKASLERLDCWKRSEWTDGRDICIGQSPVCAKDPTAPPGVPQSPPPRYNELAAKPLPESSN